MPDPNGFALPSTETNQDSFKDEDSEDTIEETPVTPVANTVEVAIDETPVANTTEVAIDETPVANTTEELSYTPGCWSGLLTPEICNLNGTDLLGMDAEISLS